MSSPEVSRVLEHADRLARAAGRAPTLEDVLQVIVLDPDGASILRNSGAALEPLALDLAHVAARSPSSASELAVALRAAQIVTRSLGRELLSLATLLSTLLGRPSRAVTVLARHGATALDVRRFLAHGIVNARHRATLPAARVVGQTISLAPDRMTVVIFNDDYTSRECVVGILRDVFDLAPDDSERLADTIHARGRAAVGEYPARTALRLIQKATKRAHRASYPLRVWGE